MNVKQNLKSPRLFLFMRKFGLLVLLLFIPIAFSQCIDLDVNKTISGNVSLCRKTYTLTEPIQIVGDTSLDLNGSTIIVNTNRIFNGTGDCYVLEVYNGTFNITSSTDFYFSNYRGYYCFSNASNLIINSTADFYFAGNLSNSVLFLGDIFTSFNIHYGYIYDVAYDSNIISDEIYHGYFDWDVREVYNTSIYVGGDFYCSRQDFIIKDSYLQVYNLYVDYLTASDSVIDIGGLIDPPIWFKLNNTNITYPYGMELGKRIESTLWKESYCNNCYINGKPVFQGTYNGEDLGDYSWVYITGFSSPYNLTLTSSNDYNLIINYDYDINIDATDIHIVQLLIDSNKNVNIEGNDHFLSLSVWNGNFDVSDAWYVYTNNANVTLTGTCKELHSVEHSNVTRYGILEYYSGESYSKLYLYDANFTNDYYNEFWFWVGVSGYFENVTLSNADIQINSLYDSNFTCIDCHLFSPGRYSKIFLQPQSWVGGPVNKYVYIDGDIDWLSFDWIGDNTSNITIVGDRHIIYESQQHEIYESGYFDHVIEGILIRTYTSRNFTTSSTFNYRIDRTAYYYNKSLVMFVDDLISWSSNLPNQTYVIGNLYPNTKYNLYINGNFVETLETDSNGYTPAFEVQFHSPANITLQQVVGYPPTAIIISPENITYQTYVAPITIEGKVLVYGSDSSYNVSFYLDGNKIGEFDNVLNNTEVSKNFSASEGTHEFKVIAVGNEFGYTTENSTVFTVEVIPAYPTIEITSPQNTTYLTNVDSRLVDFEFRVYGYDNSYNVTAYLDNNPIYSNSNFGNDSTYYTSLDVDVGTHEFKVEAIGNDYGYSSEESVIFTVERVYGPYVQIINPVNQTYCSGNISLEYTVTDTHIDKCWYSIDDGANVSLPNCENTSISLGEGNHKVTVYANNTLGDVGYDLVYFKVDLNPPTITIISPENETYVGSGTIELKTSVSDVSSTSCYYEIDGDTSSYDCNSALISVSEGSHYLKACAQDECGRVRCDEVYFTYQYFRAPAIVMIYKNLVLITLAAGAVYAILRSGELSVAEWITLIIVIMAIALTLVSLCNI